MFGVGSLLLYRGMTSMFISVVSLLPSIKSNNPIIHQSLLVSQNQLGITPAIIVSGRLIPTLVSDLGRSALAYHMPQNRNANTMTD
jgi:hypothetical protein